MEVGFFFALPFLIFLLIVLLEVCFPSEGYGFTKSQYLQSQRIGKYNYPRDQWY